MDTKTTPKPRLYRLAAAAKIAGISPDLFLRSCQLGQIPVSVIQLGEAGFWHVSAPEFVRWLEPDSNFPNLFE